VRRILDKVNKKFYSITIRDQDDWVQIEHIFLNEEFNLEKTARKKNLDSLYCLIKKQGKKPLIIDLGANIGLASKYFDIAYPESRIIAVEPDEGNCEIARKNLPSNALLFQAAISSRSGVGNLIATGRNVGLRVEAAPEGAVQFVTIQDLLFTTPDCVPFLIKIDIEGFESDLFSMNTKWIDLFPIILIELHDWMLPGSQVTSNFLKVISRTNREFMHFDGYVASIDPDLSKFTIL
jgi:FkbM family methyltransferase